MACNVRRLNWPGNLSIMADPMLRKLLEVNNPTLNKKCWLVDVEFVVLQTPVTCLDNKCCWFGEEE